MNKFFYLIEKYRYGILAVVLLYLGIFVYLQLTTYNKTYVIEVWDERAELRPEEIKIKPENIEFDKPITDVKSISKDANDQREKSLENWNENKVVVKNSSSKVENSVKELEKKFFSETGEAQKRAKIIEETQKLKDEKKSTISKKNTTEPEIKGGAKSFAGNVMVEWELIGRSPHQNNNWYVRNPGYTCGQGADGIVVVKIRVAASGNVIGVTYVSNMSSSANPCMIEQAKKYAAMSRFMFSADAPPSQEGTIKYTFVSQ